MTRPSTSSNTPAANSQIEAPKDRRGTVDRLDHAEVERLIEAAYEHSSQYGFMVKMLFYTGAGPHRPALTYVRTHFAATLCRDN